MIPEALLRASLTLSVALVLSLVLLVPVSAPETLERCSVAALPNLGPPLRPQPQPEASGDVHFAFAGKSFPFLGQPMMEMKRFLEKDKAGRGGKSTTRRSEVF